MLYSAIIIGSGFGGIAAAINLQKQGIDHFLILERRDFVGGTWMQNRYPGAAVDVPSPLYSLSSEPYDWSQLFAEQAELEQYTNHVIDKNKLRQKIALNTCVSAIHWQQEDNQWRIETTGEQVYHASFVINATGPLSSPSIPNFTGRESFQGPNFHSNNWDERCDIRNKRVAVIGSGASAAQIIPAIAPEVAHLHVYQRTPHWVIDRFDYTFKSWQRNLLKKPFFYKLLRGFIYWHHEYRVLGFKHFTSLLDTFYRKIATRKIQREIADEQLRKAVTPDFTPGCKRIILSNSLYPAYCRDNVSLHSNGISEITATSIVDQQGNAAEVDVIVFATGFNAEQSIVSYPVYGLNNHLLQDAWAEYPRAYLGTCVPNFPNYFIVTGPNTGIGHTSALYIIEAQIDYIMQCIDRVKKQGASSIAVRAEAEDSYTNHIHAEMQKTVWYKGGCNSWYKGKSGKVIATFPGFSFSFSRLAKRFKTEDHIIS